VANIAEMKQQHLYIMELVQVLSVLIREESLCATRITKELYERLISLVNEHLVARDKIFSAYLNHENEQVRKSVSSFLAGSKMIHNISNDYKKRWRLEHDRCNKHADFLKESEEYFAFLKNRIHEDESKCIAFLENV
jgi:hypothetical protein